MGKYYTPKNWKLPAKGHATTLYLCEGESEAEYVDKWLEARNADENEVRVFCFEGLGKIREKVSILVKEPGFHRLRSVCIFLDAENNFDGRKHSVAEILKKLGFPYSARNEVPWVEDSNGKHSSVFISPNMSDPGRIEDIVIRQIENSEPEVFACITTFEECANNAGIQVFDAKTKVGVYTTLKKPGVGLGIAFRSGYINQEDPAFAELNAVLASALT